MLVVALVVVLVVVLVAVLAFGTLCLLAGALSGNERAAIRPGGPREKEPLSRKLCLGKYNEIIGVVSEMYRICLIKVWDFPILIFLIVSTFLCFLFCFQTLGDFVEFFLIMVWTSSRG